jgi:hypothetical protein
MTYKQWIFLPTLLLVFASYKGNAQTEMPIDANSNFHMEHAGMKGSNPTTEFTDPVTGEVFDHYTDLRNALVDSDAKEASRIAGDLSATLESENSDLGAIAQSIANSQDLAEQRIGFAKFSNAVENLFSSGIQRGTIYKMHCPMAMDGAGADWFSEADQVRNPFYGDKMLTCGSVTKEITQ